jgi:hypothetical protein
MKRVFLALVALALLAGPAFAVPRVAIELTPTSGSRTPPNAIWSIKAMCDSLGWPNTICTAESVNTTAKLSRFDVVVTGGTGYGPDNDLASFDDTLLKWMRQTGGGFVGLGWQVYSISNSPGAWSPIDTCLAVMCSGNYNFLTSGNVHITNGSHPITTGVSDFVIRGYGEFANAGMWPGATSLGNYSTNPNAASIAYKTIGSGRSVYLGPVYFGNFGGYPSSQYYTDVNAKRLLKQAIEWAGTMPNDVGVRTLIAPAGALDSNASVTPACSTYNYGGATQSYTVRMKIGAGYNATASVTGHTANTWVYVTFPAWTAAPRGSIAVSCSTELTGDVQSSNDKRTGTVMVNAHDVGATAIKVPTSPVDSGASRVPACSLYNYGTVTETYVARLKIGASYDNTASVSGHAAGTYVYVTFPNWTAVVRGSNAMSCSTELATDFYRSNDKVTGSVDVAVHDWSAVAIVTPSGAVAPGPVVPQARVHNYGTAREIGPVTFSINGIPPYSQTVTLSGGLPVGVDTVIDFTSWNATTGSYSAKCTVALAGDQIAGNNLASSPFSVGEVDVGVTAMLAPTGSHDTSYVVVPSAKVKNFGEFAASFTAFFSFDSTGGIGPIYDQNITVTGLSALTETTLVFPEWAKPHPAASYATKCSVYLAGDGNPANDLLTGSFMIRAGGGGSGETGWVRMPDLLPGGKGKKVKDGGCLAYAEASLDADTTYIYALKGNGRCEFYRFNIEGNVWEAKESIPAMGSSGKKKPVKKGAAIATAAGMEYAAKGNGTLEWWQYDPTKSGTPTYPWTQVADIPSAAKMVKEGTGAATVQIGDTAYVYFLRGSGGNEFLRYTPGTDAWTAMAPAPTGTSGKPYKDGSCLATDGTTKVWALKGSYNEMAVYDVATNAWTAKTDMPLTGSSGKKKKAKSGAAMAYENGTIYAMKGGGTNEFWSYQCDSDKWTQQTDVPAGSGKPVKGGGAMTYAASTNALYTFKGNNTLDFFKYGLPAYGLQLAASGKEDAQSAATIHTPQSTLRISPNPFSTTTTISYALPTATNYSLKLYDVTGQLISTLASGNRSAGSYTLTTQTLARGIYVLKLATNNTTTTAKLIVE